MKKSDFSEDWRLAPPEVGTGGDNEPVVRLPFLP